MDQPKNDDRENLKLALSERVVTVTFEKADGTERVMECTTDGNRIPWPDNPVQDVNTTQVEKTKDENLIVVWDMQKEGWRSFKFDRVKSCAILVDCETFTPTTSIKMEVT